MESAYQRAMDAIDKYDASHYQAASRYVASWCCPRLSRYMSQGARRHEGRDEQGARRGQEGPPEGSETGGPMRVAAGARS